MTYIHTYIQYNKNSDIRHVMDNMFRRPDPAIVDGLQVPYIHTYIHFSIHIHTYIHTYS